MGVEPTHDRITAAQTVLKTAPVTGPEAAPPCGGPYTESTRLGTARTGHATTRRRGLQSAAAGVVVRAVAGHAGLPP